MVDMSTKSSSFFMQSISFIARFGLAAVWLYSGWSKFGDHMAMVQTVRAYELFSEPIVQFIATTLPVFELGLGLCLLFGVFTRVISGISAVVLLGFLIGIISAWARGLSIDCGCFGTGGYNPDVTTWTYVGEIIRDIIFLLGALWTIKRPFSKFAIYT